VGWGVGGTQTSGFEKCGGWGGGGLLASCGILTSQNKSVP